MSNATLLSFYINQEGECAYNQTCLSCKYGCKQSYRCSIVVCPKYSKDSGAVRKDTAV